MWGTFEAAFDITVEKPHIVKISTRPLKFEVSVDDRKILSQLFRAGKGSHTFVLDDRQLEIRWVVSAWSGKFTSIVLMQGDTILAYYGNTKAAGSHRTLKDRRGARQIPAPPLVQRQDRVADLQVKVREEVNAQESIEEVGVDEFPLDNRHGNEVLIAEHEVSKTVINEITVEAGRQADGAVSAGWLPLIQSQIAAKLSERVGHTFGDTITRRHMLRFTVKPGDSVIYTVVWKRRVRKGEYTAIVNQRPVVIPYSAYFDLSYEVKSKAGPIEKPP